jgi:uncharacterized protein YqgC (DUF456 family)
MIWVCYLLLVLVAAAGWLMVVVSLPGLFLMAAVAATYAILSSGRYLGVGTLFVLVTLAIGAEILEILLTGMAARRAGAGRGAMMAGVIGGIVGGILLSFFIPIVGTILGICLGCFAGAAGVELMSGNDPNRAMEVGWGATKGRLQGMVAKLVVGGLMMMVIIWKGWP